MVFFPWKLLRGFYYNYLKKDYRKDEEAEIRGQYDDGNFLYDKDGNQLSLDEALDQSSAKYDTSSEGNGIFGRFGSSMSNLLDMVGNFFGSLGNLDKNELFNQAYSFLNQFTGANLTGAQQQMNEFNAEQSAIQRGWQERMSNTSYQRAVADMQGAGLNPALVMGGSPGATTPSGSAASGTAVSAQASAIMDLIMQKANLAMQDKMSQRQSDTAIKTARIQSDTAIKTAQIQSDSSKYGVDVNASLTREQIRQAQQELELKEYLTTSQVDKINHEISLIDMQSLSEETKQMVNHAQANLFNTQSNRIQLLLSAEYWLISAQAELANEQKYGVKADAYLKSTEAAYKNGLIDGGYLDNLIKEAGANAALRQRLVDIKNGKPFKTDYGDLRDVPNKLLNLMFGNVVQAVDAVGGAIIGGLLK